jgi:hypothetical protein
MADQEAIATQRVRSRMNIRVAATSGEAQVDRFHDTGLFVVKGFREPITFKSITRDNLPVRTKIGRIV